MNIPLRNQRLLEHYYQYDLINDECIDQITNQSLFKKKE